MTLRDYASLCWLALMMAGCVSSGGATADAGDGDLDAGTGGQTGTGARLPSPSRTE